MRIRNFSTGRIHCGNVEVPPEVNPLNAANAAGCTFGMDLFADIRDGVGLVFGEQGLCEHWAVCVLREQGSIGDTQRLTPSGQVGPTWSMGSMKSSQCMMSATLYLSRQHGALSTVCISGQRKADKEECGLSWIVLLPHIDDNIVLISMSCFTLAVFPFWKHL